MSYLENYRSIQNSGQCIHDKLTSWSALNSTVWNGLAGVLYHGNSSSAEQRALTPKQAGAEFAADIANDTYSYSSVWEDTAMIFEAILMKHSFNVDRDMTIVPYYEDFDCEVALIKWGQRGRLGDPLIISRAEFVVAQILPEVDFSNFFINTAAPEQVTYDTSWCILDYSTTKIAKQQETTQSIRERQRIKRSILQF